MNKNIIVNAIGCILLGFIISCFDNSIAGSSGFCAPCNEPGTAYSEIGVISQNNHLRKLYINSRIIRQELGWGDREFNLHAYSLAAMAVQVNLEKSEYLSGKDSIYGYLRFADIYGNDYTKGYRVPFYRTRDTGSCFEYTTQRRDESQAIHGKPIYLVKEKELGSTANANYNLIPSPPNPSARVDFFKE